MNNKKKNSLRSKIPNQDWLRFMETADAFFVSYATTPLIIEVTPFLIGHAVELYLKAVYTKQTCNIDDAIEFRHDIKKLFSACQKNDSNFMKTFNFKTGATDTKHFMRDRGFFGIIKHQELFAIADKLSDLKYLGATKKRISTLSFTFPNSDWIDFVKEIRLYLKYPPKGARDILKESMGRMKENDDSKRFIAQVLK